MERIWKKSYLAKSLCGWCSWSYEGKNKPVSTIPSQNSKFS